MFARWRCRGGGAAGACGLLVPFVPFHVKTSNSGQSGRNGPARSKWEFSRQPDGVPDRILRPFIKEQSVRLTYRVLGKLLKVSPETLRQYVENPERQVHRATLAKFGAYYHKMHPMGYVAEKREPYGEPQPLPLLREILPEGHAAARADIEKLIELGREHPDRAPASLEKLRKWLESLLEAEYTGEDPAKRKRAPRVSRKRAEEDGAGETEEK